MRVLFESAGVDLQKPIVFTCGGGVMATALSVAANQIGGVSHKVYDGSWGEWSARTKKD